MKQPSKKRIAILGSTGSIGVQALAVVREYRNLFDVRILTANNNWELLVRQALEFKPQCVIISNKEHYDKVFEALDPYEISVFAGNESITDAMSHSDEIDLVLTAMVGFSGLEPTIAAIISGKAVAIANKEPVVAAGRLIMKLAAEHSVSILPVDSEHSAIFQALQGEHSPIENIILTASGGPFFKATPEQMRNISVAEAINHPRWKMGAKISVDSATLMNKGFEMIEARWLFGVDPDDIRVVIHPQSIIHSMVSFTDGSIIAQMSSPDMRLPIQYALTYPERLPLDIPRINFAQLAQLTFAEPDIDRFPCLSMAIEAMRISGNTPCAMNAANEVAVDAFIHGRIGFMEIPALVEKGIARAEHITDPTLEEIFMTDKTIREYTSSLIR